jgi:hypothetical protein
MRIAEFKQAIRNPKLAAPPTVKLRFVELEVSGDNAVQALHEAIEKLAR